MLQEQALLRRSCEEEDEMSVERAIEQLQAEVDAFGQGTPNQPKEHSTAWFLLRAKATGLSMLKRLRQLNIEGDAAAAERYYRKASKEVKAETAEETLVGPS